jgi:hypothetical protein
MYVGPVGAVSFGGFSRGNKGRQRKRKKATYLPTYLFLRFLRFLGLILENVFYGVFGFLMQRNGQKRDKQNDGKRRQEKSFVFLNFFGQQFLTWIFPKKFFWCFFNSPC